MWSWLSDRLLFREKVNDYIYIKKNILAISFSAKIAIALSNNTARNLTDFVHRF